MILIASCSSGASSSTSTAHLSSTTHSSTAPAAKRWSTTARWSHSWDAASAVTYKEGKTVRVASVPDASGNFPLIRYKETIVGPLPGPKYIAASAYFRGRPALFADTVATIPLFDNPTYPLSATLTAVADPGHSSAWFGPPKGYAPPYWVAVLGRATASPNSGLLDSELGDIGDGPTLAGGIPPHNDQWGISTFGPKPFPFPITSHKISPDETILIIAEVAAGKNASFIELNWRDSSGAMHQIHQAVTLNPYTAKTLFIGYVHEEYVTAAGLALGAPTASELSRVRSWAARYIPPTSLPK
ncbi:MAG: hypothetical protein ACRENN_10495 [Candidatus Eiseniibacteriota bacterium]